MKEIKMQQDVHLWPEKQVKALSYNRVVVAPDHVAFGDFLKPRRDEVARYQLRASALINHNSVMRIRRFLYL
jgi:hypothetical protein